MYIKIVKKEQKTDSLVYNNLHKSQQGFLKESTKKLELKKLVSTQAGFHHQI